MPFWFPIAWKFVKHFAIYVLIAGIIFGVPFVSYQYGWRKGYATCAKENPTYGQVGTVINKKGATSIISVDIGKFAFGGFWKE